MKKVLSLICFAFIGVLLLTGCKKEENEPGLEVKIAGMSDNDSKALFNSEDYLSLIFEDGDVMRVNGAPYTLRYENGKWIARGASGYMTNSEHDTLLGNKFYCFYGQSPATASPTFPNPSYGSVSFVNSGSQDGSYTVYKPGFVMAGATSDSTLTLYPAFAVIRVYNQYSSITLNSFQVGFGNNAGVKTCGSITPTSSYPTIGSPTYLTGVSHTVVHHPVFGDMNNYEGEFLKSTMAQSPNISSKYKHYVIVPLASNSVTTDLYFKFNESYGGSSTDIYKKVSNFTLQRGRVYTFDINDL